MEILHGGVEALFAKVAKTLKKQSETEGAGSYQSLWKPLWFWFVSLNFWAGVLAIQSVTLMVPELEQRRARPARSAGRKILAIRVISVQKRTGKSGKIRVRTALVALVALVRTPTPF